jgi:DNA end-binding protein Ku
MKRQNKVALARWISAHREHLVILRPYEKGLVLHTMYYADEVRDFSAVDVETAPIKDKEVKLAEMLIDELTEKKFNPLQYKDEYRERLVDRIRAKSKGRDITAQEPKEEKGGEVIDIMEALRRSLEGGGRTSTGRTAARSTTRRTAARRAPAKRAAKPKARSAKAATKKRRAG